MRPSPTGAGWLPRSEEELCGASFACVAQDIADGLRDASPGITPLADGSRNDSPARTAKGFTKLNVGYSTPELASDSVFRSRPWTIGTRAPPGTPRTTAESTMSSGRRRPTTTSASRTPFSPVCSTCLRTPVTTVTRTGRHPSPTSLPLFGTSDQGVGVMIHG